MNYTEAWNKMTSVRQKCNDYIKNNFGLVGQLVATPITKRGIEYGLGTIAIMLLHSGPEPVWRPTSAEKPVVYDRSIIGTGSYKPLKSSEVGKISKSYVKTNKGK